MQSAIVLTARRVGPFASTAGAVVLIAVGAVVLLGRFVPDFLASQRYELDLGLAAGALGLLAMVWGLDALRYRHLGQALGIDLGWSDGLRLMMLFHLGSWLTPGSIGGQPAVAWYLKRRGVELATAIALSGLGPLFTVVVMASGAVFALAAAPTPPPGLLPAVGGAVVVALGLGGIVAVALSRPAAAAALRRIRGASVAFLAGQLGLAIAWYVASLALLVTLVAAVGVAEPLVERIVDGALFRATAHFAPTPAGAGVAEGGLAWFFGTSHAIALIIVYRIAFFGIEGLVGLGVVGAELLRREPNRSMPRR